jgi:hypothetical protein
MRKSEAQQLIRDLGYDPDDVADVTLGPAAISVRVLDRGPSGEPIKDLTAGMGISTHSVDHAYDPEEA